MKNWLTQFAGLCLATLVFSSCEKDEVRAVAQQPATTPGLTASSSNIVLSETGGSTPAVSFTFTPVSYGFEGQMASYTLELAKKGDAFKSPKRYTLTPGKPQAFTNDELQAVLLGFSPDKVNGQYTAVDVEARVVSRLGTTESAAAYNKVSPIVSFKAQPFTKPDAVIVYPSLYVPGGYQGWAPDKAAGIASPKDDGNYEGYIYFADASEFKFTPAKNWDNDYGSDGTATGLAPKGGNLKVTEGGYYKLNVDLNSKKYSATKTTWAVIGSATAKGWDGDTPMTYDAATGTWSVTTALTAGKIKFRANGAWDINFGDGSGTAKPADGMPEYGADDIVVAEAGTYLITLDLSKGAGNYRYTLKK